MRIVALTCAVLLAGCASVAARKPDIPAVIDIASQRGEVDAALQPLAGRMKADEAALEALEGLTAEQRELSTDALFADFSAAEAQLLTALADRGNAEAMHRLATRLRDSSEPADIRRWLGWESRAAGLGHPGAHDELARWYWHQKGDGSMRAIQAFRAIALDHADKAASGGVMHGIDRIATYIAGDVHQYPANLPLAQALMGLCARTDYGPCQERLAFDPSYAGRVGPLEQWLWLTRLAKRQPARFVAARDAAFLRLSPDQRVSAEALRNAWTPRPWSDLRQDWLAIAGQILDHGATSPGAEVACTTMTPWCRGPLAMQAP